MENHVKSKMYTLSELSELIEQGAVLSIAGEETQLKQLPKGNWVAGTIPYFMSDEGGLVSREKIYATQLPDYVEKVNITLNNETQLTNIYSDSPNNGFTLVIIPAMSPVHLSYALKANEYKDFAAHPVIGWISGMHLDDLGKQSAKVINGLTGEVSDSQAVTMQITLPDNFYSEIDIVNIFEQGTGDTFEFLDDGFSVKDVLINGEKTNFADYLLTNKIDTKQPLVADYAGAMVNISFQGIDEETMSVNLYAPVFKNVEYKQAAVVEDYVNAFENNIPKNSDKILFSCNCILNFLYSELEGKQTSGITGPITFGEIAYKLLNQTMVYITIHELENG